MSGDTTIRLPHHGPAMASCAAGLFVAASILGLISLAVPASPDIRTEVVLANSLAALLLGAVTFGLRHRMTLTLMVGIYTLGVGVICIEGLFSYENRGVNAVLPQLIYHLWTALFAAYFFPRRLAVAAVVVTWSVAVIEITAGNTDVSPAVWFVVVGSLAVAAALVAVLKEQIYGLVGRLDHAARTDPLTGLANRRAFEDALALELRRAERLGTAVALLVADVDHFKQINDNHGHAAGDCALKGLAGVLLERTRAVDLAGRIGGEEFGIVMPGATAREGLLVAERLRVGLAALAEDAVPTVTVSVGVAEYPRHGTTPEELLRGADVALYAAKDSGRDTVVLALSHLPTRRDTGPPMTSTAAAEGRPARSGDALWLAGDLRRSRS